MIKITDSNLKETVFDNQGILLVDFWAPWCGPCKMLAPILEEIDREGAIRCGEINVDEYQGIAQRFNVRALPTLILFKEGNPIGQLTGSTSRSDIIRFVEDADGAIA